MTATLYSLPTSHPALAARAMLEHKGIDHRVVELIPGLHPPVLRLRGFPAGTVPALVLDGRRIQGSREISRALDAVRADPPLFPEDAERRRAVEDAERWGEEVLQPVARRIFRWTAAHSYAVRRWLAVDVSHVPLGAAIARPPLQAKLFARAAGADDATVRADLAAVPGHLAHVEALRRDGVIDGEAPNAADFQIASSVRSLAHLADLGPLIADHPAVRWAATVGRDMPGPAPAALPPAWLEPVREGVAAPPLSG